MNNETIHGKPDYLSYQFDLWTFPVLIAAVPIFYILPTILIVIKIIRVYIKHVFVKKDDAINPHVFSMIVLQLVLSFFYMLADYFTIRLPSTGLLTNWCASQTPNHGLKMLYFLSVYFNYTALLFPFLLSILRLFPIFYPMRVSELCARTVRICTPILFVYPLFFCFPLFPALGDCRQLLGAYPFGSIYIYWNHSWFDLKLAGFLLINLVFWISACTIVNIILYGKLQKLRKNSESKRLQKAELSLTLTTLSMLFAHITNLVLVAVAIFYPSFSVYFLAIRPYGSDCDFVFVPWIFYLTHPIFKTQKIEAKVSSKEEQRVTRVPIVI